MARDLAVSGSEQPDRPREADGPGRGSPGDLRARLQRFPEWHPSSPRFQSRQAVDHPPAPSAEQRDGTPADAKSTGASSGTDALSATVGADHPSAADIRLSRERLSHILDGDQTGGSHRHGTGRPGKTEFPADWADAKITGAVLAVACEPDQAPVRQNWNERWRVSGKHDGVEIVAIVASDGQIWTAWPREGSPGVVKNQREDT